MKDLAAMADALDGVRRSTRDGLAQWRCRGRLVARQLDDTHVVVRSAFDYRDVLLRDFPDTFSVPRRFWTHMMVVVDVTAADADAVDEALVAARDLQSRSG